MALDRIQTDALSRLGLESGNYSFFASRLESGLVEPELIGLDEYGLPIQVGKKLAEKLQLNTGLDAAIDSLKRITESSYQNFPKYEQSIILRVQDSLIPRRKHVKETSANIE